MKKYFMIFAAALLSFAACQEEMSPETTPNEDEIFDYPIEMTFTAGNEAATKTLLSGSSITWESDDQIKVLWSETGYNMAIAEPFGENTCAKFTTNVQEAEAYYAVHPYAAESSYSEGNIVVTIPSEQGGAFENANIAVAKATENYAFPFRHLVGIVEFSTDTPGKVTISGAEDDVLTGTVTVTGFDENGYPVYNEDKVTDASSTIEIEVSQAGTYYAAFLPSATLKCLSVKVEGSEATEYALSPNQLQMARGKVWELGNIDGIFGKNLFVTATADGNGDGKTWETALTFQQMANMVAARNAEGPSAPTGNTSTALDGANDAYLIWHNGDRAEALDGVTFHIAEGTYKTSSYVRISFPNRENAVKLSFKGGYSSESQGTDLSKRFVDAGDVTIMTGENERRHFFVRYSSNVTFDGITFTEGNPNYIGGSFLFNESATSSLNFNNCKFVSNKAGTGNTHYGGAVCGSSAGNVGTAVFNNCEFTSNSSNAGGAVYANSGVWNFKDCIVKNNSSTGAAGAFELTEDAEVSVSGGSFVTNTAVSDAGAMRVACKSFTADDVDFIGNKGAQTAAGNSQGGAIYFANNESGSERTVSNCLFKENTVDAANAVYSSEEGGTKNYVRGGAVYIQASSPNVVFTTCTFESNQQLNTESYKKFGGGAIYSTKSFTVTGCTFTTNDAHQFGAICVEKGSVSINGTFTSNTAVDGGAVGVYGGSVSFTECQFSQNSSSNYGGALYATGGVLDIKECVFSENQGTGTSSFGGALSATTASLTCTGCEFSSNTSVNNGGAVWLSAMTKADFTDCDFTSNECTQNLAGAICLSGANPLTITRGVFSGNKAGKGGGCLYNNAASTIKITGAEFKNNESSTLGGVFYGNDKATDAVITIADATFSGNKAKNGEAGAIYFKAGKWNVTNTKFENNTATSNGGAIYANVGTLTVTGGSFSGNVTTAGSVGGGAIYVTAGSELSATNVTFSSNSAQKTDGTGAGKGGAVSVSSSAGAEQSISLCRFTSNSSVASGGGLYAGGGTVKLSDSIFKSNSSAQGAAVRGEGNGTLYMNGCSITDNVPGTSYTAGTVYTGITTFINNTSFHDYTGANNNADLVINAGTTTVLNTSFVESGAKTTGVRLYGTGTVANLYNNVILAGAGSVVSGWYEIVGNITSAGYNYTSAWSTGPIKNNSVHSVTMADTDVTTGNMSEFTLASTTDGRGYYTWTKPAEVTGTTAADVTAFLNGITGGGDFATWLGTVGGLTHDIAGNERPDEGWYPGCYQGE